MSIKIIGTGSSLPEHIVSNADLAETMDTSDEWIKSRTGISERRIARGQTTAGLAIEAGKKAVEDAGINPEELDIIIVATVSPGEVMPSISCQVQSAIGAVQAVAFDLNAACSGFLFALNTVHAYIKSGVYKSALVIGAERMSELVDWNDRSTCVLFGDAAGAAVIKSDHKSLYHAVQHTDGTKGRVLTCKEHIYMEGQEVFKFAVKKVPECIEELLARSGCKKEEVTYFILHQANQRIIESIARRLGQECEKFPVNMNKYGNTSAASVPVLLDELNRAGALKKGDKVILSGFGAGLTWAASLLEW